MLVTIKESTHVWTSPDGRVKIYDFKGMLPDGEEISASTRSDKIAAAINQTLDLTTTVSKSGKTYYIQVPREQPYAPGAPTAPVSSKPDDMVLSTTMDVDRFMQAVERFEKAVDKLTAHYEYYAHGDIIEPEQRQDDSAKHEIVLDDELPDELSDDLQQAINILDREMSDRIDDDSE